MTFSKRIQNKRAHRRVVYQMWGTVDAGGNLEKGLCRVVDRVLVYLSKAMDHKLPPEAGKYESFSLDSEAGHCECIADLERRLWSLRYRYEDEAECLWFYDIAMIEEAGELLFGIKIETTPDVDVREAQENIPLVYDLMVKVGLKQVRSVLENSWNIEDPAEVDALYEFLTSPHRSFPAIVFSEVNWKTWDLTPNAPQALVDMVYLAPKVVGYAYVVRLSFRASYAWKTKVGNAWAVFDGACRTYFPNVDFRNGVPLHHPCNFKDKIWHWVEGGQRGVKAYASFLIRMVHRVATTSYSVRKGLYFVPDARVLVAELELTRAVQQANAPERELALRRQVEALKIKLENADEENQDWLSELEQAQEAVDYYRQENTALRAQIDALRAHLSRQSDGEMELEQAEALPTSLEELPEWVKKHLVGRLVLLPRAERAVSKSDYTEPEMVYRALQILATQYRDSRMGIEGADEACKAAFAEVGMELSGSIDRNRAKQFGDDYYVNYPIGTDRREFLEFHIERGNSREARYCMRVYFFWDEETSQVVVGWLPGHLRNRMT